MNAIHKRLINALEAVTCNIVTDTMQRHTADAVVRLAEQDYKAVTNIFVRMFNNGRITRPAARTYLRWIAMEAQCGSVLALFDYDIGFMAKVASDSSQSTINDYVTELFGFSESPEDHREIKNLVSDYFTRCNDCREWESDDELSTTYHDESVCRECRDGHYEYSDYYGSYVHCDVSANALDRDGSEVVIHNDDSRFTWDEEEDMYVHTEYAGNVLGNYHSSKGRFVPIESPWTQVNSFYIGRRMPASEWLGTKYQRYFGVELEIESKHGEPRDHADRLNDVLNKGEKGHRCFFERDGSLSYGFEIITQPMGLDLHAEFWRWTQDKALTKGLLSHNTSTCGLHVHVTKTGLTRMQISKMVSFVNHPDNRQLVETIARRYGSNYATIHNKKIATAHFSQSSRYEAVNLEPTRTVEFRLFKGTLKYESIMSALEFTNALVNFCNDQSGYGFDLSTKAFLEFIEKPVIAHDTKFLRAYISNKFESQ